eukprot:SAG22_NODE_72_length_22344_cov_95.586559_17_plen_69_part_00
MTSMKRSERATSAAAGRVVAFGVPRPPMMASMSVQTATTRLPAEQGRLSDSIAASSTLERPCIAATPP